MTFGFMPGVPPSLAPVDKLPEDDDRRSADYEAFREYLIQEHGR